MTKEGMEAIRFVQERGFDAKAYSPEQASLITKAVKASSLGLFPVEEAEKLLPIIKEQEGISVEDILKALEDKMENFIFQCATIKASLGTAHYGLFLKRGLKNSSTRYFNMMTEAIMYGVTAVHTPLTWVEKAEIVSVFEKQGWEEAELYAAELCNKKIAAERG